MKYSKPFVRIHSGIHVVRDDLLCGGTKMRYCGLLAERHDHLVYASSAQGGAQLALAYAARAAGHRATIFVAKRKVLHPRTAEAAAAGARIEQVDPGYLAVVQKRARDFAEREGAHLVEFGAEGPEALQAIAKAARQVNNEYGPFDEVWSAVGSGVLTRGLQMGIMGARFFGVAVGREVSIEHSGIAVITPASMAFEKMEPREAPFPSCPNYDRKAWHECVAAPRTRRGAHVLFWNVVGPSPTPFASK